MDFSKEIETIKKHMEVNNLTGQTKLFNNMLDFQVAHNVMNESLKYDIFSYLSESEEEMIKILFDKLIENIMDKEDEILREIRMVRYKEEKTKTLDSLERMVNEMPSYLHYIADKDSQNLFLSLIHEIVHNFRYEIDKEMKLNELLPCPFCGSKSYIYNDDCYDDTVYIQCPNCGIHTVQGKIEDVIKIWNKRT